MKLDILKLDVAQSGLAKAHSLVKNVKLEYTREIMDYVILSVIHEYEGYYENREYHDLMHQVTQRIFRWMKAEKGKTDSGIYGTHELYHSSRYEAFVLHNCDFLTNESSWGSGGTYWWDSDIDDKYDDEVPFFFDKKGMYIRYDADMDEAKKAFEEFYFKPINDKLKEIKQFDLFENT